MCVVKKARSQAIFLQESLALRKQECSKWKGKELAGKDTREQAKNQSNASNQLMKQSRDNAKLTQETARMLATKVAMKQTERRKESKQRSERQSRLANCKDECGKEN